MPQTISISFEDLSEEGQEMFFDHTEIDQSEFITGDIGDLKINEDLFNSKSLEEIKLQPEIDKTSMSIYVAYLTQEKQYDCLKDYIEDGMDFDYDIFIVLPLGVLTINDDLIPDEDEE